MGLQQTQALRSVAETCVTTIVIRADAAATAAAVAAAGESGAAADSSQALSEWLLCTGAFCNE